MKKDSALCSSIDEYIIYSSADVRELLVELRNTINKAAPEAEEVISFQMPAFKMNGILVYFAACKKHIGFYPTSSGIKAFSKELAPYKSSKGSVQFPLDKPLPLKLIARIVKFRVKENKAKLNKVKSKK